MSHPLPLRSAAGAAALAGADLDAAAAAARRVGGDGKAKACTARGARAHLVHAVEAVENAGHVPLWNADAIVADGEKAVLFIPREQQLHKAARAVILDGVFRQVVDDLVNFILARKGLSLAANFTREVDLLFLGHKAQHAHHARHHGREVNALRLGQHAAVQARQSQQIFRDARQALGLLLDITDKFAHGLRVHVLRLQN